MHERYTDLRIKLIFSDEEKLLRWQNVEIAVMQAYAERGDFSIVDFECLQDRLLSEPINIALWKQFDKEMSHDLNAFLAERTCFIELALQPMFHNGITSYDTEESAFVKALDDSSELIMVDAEELFRIIATMAQKYRYTPMWLRTHGQGAEVGSFGKRLLSWSQELLFAINEVRHARTNLEYSKISGACGNFTSIDPEIANRALEILGFKQFYGATQIMPRSLYVPLASALCTLVGVMDDIMTDIRLGARSGPFVLYREPFGKKQKGSSAMPHKKNTITSEQEEGLFRMALGYQTTITANIKTWEERAIEQSCVERVAWPDLFHVTAQAIKNVKKVLSGLKVYPENMMAELVSSKGCYATTEAQKVLKELVAPFGIPAEEAYRIVQLAAFNLHSPKEVSEPTSIEEAEKMYLVAVDDYSKPKVYESLRAIIERGELVVSIELEATDEQVVEWNNQLREIFGSNGESIRRWREVFMLRYLMRNEHVLFEQTLGS